MIDFDNFYNDNFEGLCNYAFSIVNKSDVAKDIVQESFIKLSECHQDIEHGKYRNWMKRVIKNKCVDYFRKNSYKEIFIDDCSRVHVESNIRYNYLKLISDEDDIVKRLENIDEESIIQSRYKVVMSKVEQLTPMYKLVFKMYEIDNLTHAFIARELGISEGTSKSNLYKAKKNIRKMIKDDDDDVKSRF
jgi:RNA polymerase sigma factor (sigma-70 family)